MAPTRPYLAPLSTPKNMTFPSELRERNYTCLDSAKPIEPTKKPTEDIEMAITPPSAYTEFLNTFSPIFASPNSSRANFSKYMLDKPAPSPTSAPPSATSFSSHHHRRSTSSSSSSFKHSSSLLPIPSARCIKSPKSPDHPRRLRLPPPHQQQHLYTPVTASPLSAYPPHHRPSPRYSPSEWRFHQIESPATDRSFNLHQVVTTTITFRVAPRLAAPPAGKRKRAAVRKNP
ncbi:hypothetical protein BDW59DRAFT_150606 [Aspergillus cavernicola]|uniref:Uncharacterized protein n=1 Tax=Aspergillus cavernicola TaxID=176166 RepID=A0ABR4I0I7_9EURO